MLALGHAIPAIASLIVSVAASQQQRFIGRVQSWLMLQGEAGAAAAGIAQLVSGWSPDKVLAVARDRFVYVSADKVLQSDMADNKPNPTLQRLTEKGHSDHSYVQYVQ